MPVFECNACFDGNDCTTCHIFVEYPEGSVCDPSFCPWGEGTTKAVWRKLGVVE
jgi:hypothetical protein